MAVQVLRRHPERINRDIQIRLSAQQGAFHVAVNLINISICHGVAADGFAVTVNHQIIPAIAVRPVELIGKTKVDSSVKPTVWIEL